MEETNSTQYEGELDEFDTLIVPRCAIFGTDGNVTRAPIVTGAEVVDAGVFGDVLAEELGDACARSDGSVGQAGGDFDLFSECVQDVPEACVFISNLRKVDKQYHVSCSWKYGLNKSVHKILY